MANELGILVGCAALSALLAAPVVGQETTGQGSAAADAREGWLSLLALAPLDAWVDPTGWGVGMPSLDPEHPRALVVADDGAAIVNTAGPGPANLTTRFELEDVELELEFLIPAHGNSGVYLMGRYEIQVLDSSGKTQLDSGDCGGIYHGERGVWDGRAPDHNAFAGPGAWNHLRVVFRAPRFDPAGAKLAHARFETVELNGVVLHSGVEVTGTTGGALGPEAPRGPLMLQGDHGPVGYRDIRVRALAPAAAPSDEGWTRIFDGKSLAGWRISDGGKWRVEDGCIVGLGPRSHLFSPRGDYKNLELRARCKINAIGNSGMYFRTAFGPGWPEGYEAQVNSSYPDPTKTGSLYNHVQLKTSLVPADTWFTQAITCRDTDAGVHITIRVNDVVVVDYLDRERKHATGHVAFQQHHVGSVVHFRDVEVRELP